MRLDTKEYLEGRYAERDPWGYQKNPADLYRRKKIVEVATDYGPEFDRALDVGAGEGWITQKLPAKEIHGYEIADNAAERFPSNVTRVTEPVGKYDLVLASAVFYKHYDYELMHRLVLDHACGIVVTCHLEEHEIPLPERYREIVNRRFRYMDKTDIVRVYDFRRNESSN